MIRVDSLTLSFGRTRVLRGVSFEVARGEAVALWGPNGAGKTTVIRAALGLLPFRGTITIDGVDVRRRGKTARSLVGYVPQELSFYDDLRAGEAVRLFGRLRRTPKARGIEALERVGLADQRRKRIGALSGGMKQRLALALALLADPPALILDEPTSNLDAQGRADMLDALVALRESGKTILFTSHRSEEMDQLAHRVLTIEQGRIVGERRSGDRCAGGAARVTVHLSEDEVARAAEAVAGAGASVQRNGRTISFDACPSALEAPLRALRSAEVDVLDCRIRWGGDAEKGAQA